MNCTEAEVYVSALCDGQQIPDDARAHVLACETCHRTLRVYAEMGAELRLASLVETAPLPPLRLPHSRKRPFWTKQVPMPRLAIAGLAICAVVLPLAVSIAGANRGRCGSSSVIRSATLVSRFATSSRRKALTKPSPAFT